MIFEKEGERYSLEEFEKMTGAKWLENLQFLDPSILARIKKKTLKYTNRGEVTLEQIWLGRYFQKEILSKPNTDVSISWINQELGWGVFALRNFRKMEFISEYTGIVRKSRRQDRKNAYCFEYPICSGLSTPYTIDALEQGGISRYINHSDEANLNSSLATVDGVGHIILYTKKPVAKGEQLCYDYGPNYWAKRTAPLSL